MLVLFKDDVGRDGEAAGHSKLGISRQVTTLDSLSISDIIYCLFPFFFLQAQHIAELSR